MNNYRVIVLDLDGTLLNSNKEVSERNLAAVMSCYRKGMKIVFATARPPRAVKRFLPDALLEIASFIYYNGAQAYCPHTNTAFHESIPSEVTAEITDYCLKRHPDLELSMEVRDEWFSLREHDYRVTMNAEANPIVIPLDEFKQRDATKILLSGAFEGTPLYDSFRHLAHILYTDNNRLVQVMPPNASKEQAVLKLCRGYGFEMDSVMAFGDDHNDLGLARACGYSVAMGNAIDELKAIADEVTASNDEDGVAAVLERL
ncbi:Cof-type HAD-IIB family hydrolase [Cohnella panacarvi]|uniref:Cof-type HAD-IIB family hydrolase n=1 Tax=Cohnella panacarvi TaxID=400776 RepID=UPI000479A2D0|nr:Cof-type HAD-IIB family hydrolase [Cohnella panacarvi]